MKNLKNKGFPTSLEPKIHCNSVPKIFDPFFNHITTNPINKSFKEIESDDNTFLITKKYHTFINTNSDL